MRNAISRSLVVVGVLMVCLVVSAAIHGKPGAATHSAGISSDVIYGKIGGRELHLLITRPEAGSQASSRRPAVVYIHGGGWYTGHYAAPYMPGVFDLVQQGYVRVSVDYRLSGEAKWPAQINDCKAAIRYLRANAAILGIDPEKIAVYGDSAGGHLAVLVATSGDTNVLDGPLNPGYSSRVKCAIDLYGPIQFDLLHSVLFDPKHLDDPNRLDAKLFGKPVAEAPDLVKQANPITYIGKSTPPILILHGTADPLVPIDQSEMFLKALKASGTDATFYLVEGGDHGGDKFEQPMYHKIVVDFLAKHLKS